MTRVPATPIPAPDIQITVQVQHSPAYSVPGRQAFQYVITVENRSDQSWQLLRRHWQISDAAGQSFVVDGDGVVGEQPLLVPGASYTYDSFVTVEAVPGVMQGHYTMRDAWGHETDVPVPPFRLDTLAHRVLN